MTTAVYVFATITNFKNIQISTLKRTIYVAACRDPIALSMRASLHHIMFLQAKKLVEKFCWTIHTHHDKPVHNLETWRVSLVS